MNYDKEAYKYRIKAQKACIESDKDRLEAYSLRSQANGMFAKALKLKEKAYLFESKSKNQSDPIWLKVYKLKVEAFTLESKAQMLNAKIYGLKESCYRKQTKEAENYAKFTENKAKYFQERLDKKLPGDCATQ